MYIKKIIKKNSNKGFTLLELIIIILIVSIIMAFYSKIVEQKSYDQISDIFYKNAILVGDYIVYDKNCKEINELYGSADVPGYVKKSIEVLREISNSFSIDCNRNYFYMRFDMSNHPEELMLHFSRMPNAVVNTEHKIVTLWVSYPMKNPGDSFYEKDNYYIQK